MKNKSPKKATIYDIAKYCGVSTATVSRVLNKPDYPVNEATRKQVLEAVKELHYTPNLIGQNLKTQQCRDIGVVIPNISNPYYAALLQGIYDIAISGDYNIILTNSYRNPEIEAKNIRLLIQKQVSGIILVSISQDPEAVKEALNYGCRVVVVEQDIAVDCIKIGFNFERGAYLAASHLIENNHRKIALIGAPLDRPSRIQMLEGYKRCLREHGISIEEDYILLSGFENESEQSYEYQNGLAKAEQLCAMENCPTACICINDMTAFGIMKGLRAKGLRVPDDISVIGFDNIPYSEISTPELTTIDQFSYDMGSISTRILIESIEEPEKPQYSVSLEPKLVERNTVKSLN